MITDFIAQLNDLGRKQYVSEWMMALDSPDIVRTILSFAVFSDDLTYPRNFKNIPSIASKAKNICKLEEGFETFYAFKKVYGNAGTGKAWYHIVEQSTIESCGFSPERVQNPGNLIKIVVRYASWYSRINKAFSTKGKYFPDMPLREYLKGKSFETHYEWGLKVMRETKP